MGIDPVGVDENNVHSHNRYAYANNNPYRFVDPTGNIAETALDVVSLGLSIAQYNQDPSILNGIGLAYDVIGTAVPILPAGFGIIRSAGKAGASGVEAAVTANQADNVADSVTTSRAARRQAMRDAGIPTSQQPVSQSKNASSREYSYDTPASGGGTERMSVQQQTMDRSHPGQGHWEAGRVKTDPLTGGVRTNRYGRPALRNDKSKVDY